jgi:predicted Zn finger-like uncharacterized protein
MNYITSCPKCETHFLINDDLIKAHRGKVQCGSCEHVFNAKNRLTEVADDITSADEYQASLDEDQLSSDEPTSDHNDATQTSVNADVSINENAQTPTKITFDTNTATPPEQEDVPPILDDFTKSLEPAKKTKKHTVLLSIFSLLLILTAAIQTIYHLRVQIAAEHPQFKPLLVKACAQIKCTVDLPRNLDLITIGDSDMQEDDLYQSVINFSSSLTNNANYPQAYPNIELTLTDIDDKIVIKKFIPPEEYLSDNKQVKDGLAAHEVNAVKLVLYVKEATVAGYRILLVY